MNYEKSLANNPMLRTLQLSSCCQAAIEIDETGNYCSKCGEECEVEDVVEDRYWFDELARDDEKLETE